MLDLPTQGTFNPSEMQRNGFASVSFGSDEKLWVQFHTKPVLDPVKSREMGRPFYNDVPFCRIQQPAEKDCFDQPATQEHIARFPRQWAAYQQGRQDAPQGTLLAVLFPDNPSIVEMLAFLKVKTVEQLAALNDTQLQNVGMGARQWQQKAQAFLASADKGRGLHAMEQTINEQRAQIEKLTATVNAMSERFNAAGEIIPQAPAPRKKPGPKPKPQET